MALVVCLLFLSILLAVAVRQTFTRPKWQRGLAGCHMIVAATLAVWILLWHVQVLTVLVSILSVYAVFNDARLLRGQMHQRYLRWSTWRTAFWLTGMQAVLVLASWLWQQATMSTAHIWLATSVADMLVALLITFSLRHNLVHSKLPRITKHYSDAQLPSLTVAIPARNETDDLEQCLITLVQSNYPKLEIIVLDDCSQDKHTPEIIRSFAHEGVRFVQGEEPKPTWLAKNQAYDQLAHQASGEYILFCGVDVRFTPDSLRQLVTLALSRKKRMLSIVPMQPTAVRPSVSIVQAMRYWWELVPPRRWFKRPPVLSSCWLIERRALERAGGFSAVTRSIVPEAYFAKAVMRGDGYSFLRSNQQLGITSLKNPVDQMTTAVRMRYPQLHRRPEQVFLVSLVEISALLLPFAMLAFSWLLHMVAFALACTVFTCMLLIYNYVCLVLATKLNRLPYALVGLPIMIVSDIIVLHRSMWQYEFSEVVWKGRNVCIPVMHTYPSLPKIN